MEAVAPPRVGAFGGGVQRTEGIHEPGIQKLGELGALLVGKAGVATIGARVLQVYLLVRHVEVAAHHHGLRVTRRTIGEHARLQVLAHRAEGIVPGHAVIEARQLALRVRRVHIHEPVLVELAQHHAPFGVQLGDAHFVQHLQRLFLAEHRRARIALALGVAPELMVAGKVHLDLAFLQLGFLQGEHIGVQLGKGVHEPLLHNGAQAVHVPRNQSHENLLVILADRIVPRNDQGGHRFRWPPWVKRSSRSKVPR